MKKFALVPAVLALAIASSAFANEPAAFDASAIRPGMEKDYRDARKDEAKAQQDLVKAKGDADRARAQLVEGERLMTQGSAALDAQKAAYKVFATRVGLSTSAKSVDSEVSALKDIAKLWADAESTYEEGAKLNKRAQKDLGKSEERRVKAEAKLARSRTEIAGAIVQPPTPEVVPVDLTGGPVTAPKPSMIDTKMDEAIY
jgi:uncharacterized protein (DUF3084 family)